MKEMTPRERVLAACDAVFGHRLMMDGIAPGGMAAFVGGKTIIEVIRDKSLLTEEQIAKIMDAKKMTEPGIPGQ